MKRKCRLHHSDLRIVNTSGLVIGKVEMIKEGYKIIGAKGIWEQDNSTYETPIYPNKGEVTCIEKVLDYIHEKL